MNEIKIPKALIDQIKDGNVILFLGAGAAFDSKHPKDKKPVSYTHLTLPTICSV